MQPARHVAVRRAVDVHQDVAAAWHLDVPRAAAAHCRGHPGEFVLSLNAYYSGSTIVAILHPQCAF